MDKKYRCPSFTNVWAQLYISLIKAVVLPEGVTTFTHFKLDLHKDQRNQSLLMAIYEVDFVFGLIPGGIEEIGRLVLAPLKHSALGESLQKSFEEGLLSCIMGGKKLWHGLLECPDAPVNLNGGLFIIIEILGRSGVVDSPGHKCPEHRMKEFEREGRAQDAQHVWLFWSQAGTISRPCVDSRQMGQQDPDHGAL